MVSHKNSVPKNSVANNTKHSLHATLFKEIMSGQEFFIDDHSSYLPRFSEIDDDWVNQKSIAEFRKPFKRVQKASQSTKNELSKQQEKSSQIQQIVPIANKSSSTSFKDGGLTSTYYQSLLPKNIPTTQKPKHHLPWKLYRVISGHFGWVRCVALEPDNKWFATGSSDRMIKIWDLASGKLKLSLTGHISSVRGIVISPRHPYMFSCGEDKQVKCWDLECNKVIRNYHGHLSGVYSIDIHPTIDVLITGGRDAAVNVWDIRTKFLVRNLGGHKDTVADIKCRSVDPQVITASHDKQIRLWDLANFSTMSVLTNHKKSVRSISLHPKKNMMLSSSTSSIKQWVLPDGNFYQNFTGQNTVINSLCVNEDDVTVSAGDDGSLHFWDFNTGYCFQKTQPEVQPGSISSEAGILDVKFDRSGSRLITCNIDKTIRMYKEDETEMTETNTEEWKPKVAGYVNF